MKVRFKIKGKLLFTLQKYIKAIHKVESQVNKKMNQQFIKIHLNHITVK